MFVFLTVVSVGEVQQHVCFTTFDSLNEILGYTEPLRYYLTVARRRRKVKIDMVMRSGVVLVMEYVCPLLDRLVLHASFLYVNG